MEVVATGQVEEAHQAAVSKVVWEALKEWAVAVILMSAGNMKKIGIIGLIMLLLMSCHGEDEFHTFYHFDKIILNI